MKRKVMQDIVFGKADLTFVQEDKFADYVDGKDVKNFPNPYYKEVKGKRFIIIPAGEKITFTKMSNEDKRWFGIIADEDVYEGSTQILGWFPTEVVCGIAKKHGYHSCFSALSPLAHETGWLDTNGNFGSKNDAFLASKVKVASDYLKKAGFQVVFKD